MRATRTWLARATTAQLLRCRSRESTSTTRAHPIDICNQCEVNITHDTQARTTTQAFAHTKTNLFTECRVFRFRAAGHLHLLAGWGVIIEMEQKAVAFKHAQMRQHILYRTLSTQKQSKNQTHIQHNRYAKLKYTRAKTLRTHAPSLRQGQTRA